MKLRDSPKAIRHVLGGRHHIGTTLIEKGTAMGPLIPLLFTIVPILAVLAWLFMEVALVAGIPVLSVLCLLGIAGIIVHYLYHYTNFARRDPDRLQSEKYRTEMRQLQVIAAKGLVEPLPGDVLEDPTPNPKIQGDDSEREDRPSGEPRDGNPE